MSSHYIAIVCSTPTCSAREHIYTGEITTDLFDDAGPDSWEGEEIRVRCKECQAAALDARRIADGRALGFIQPDDPAAPEAGADRG